MDRAGGQHGRRRGEDVVRLRPIRPALGRDVAGPGLLLLGGDRVIASDRDDRLP